MKKETIIPIKLIIIFLSILLFITLTGCWGAILEAVQQFMSFCFFIVFIGVISFIIHKVLNF